MKESQSSSAHFGMTKCMDLLNKRYYWPGITVDFDKDLVACHKCKNMEVNWCSYCRSVHSHGSI